MLLTHVSHDLGTVTFFRLLRLELGFRVLGLGLELELGLGLELGLSLKYKRLLQNYMT